MKPIKALSFAALFALAGCQSIDNGHPVNCDARYEISTFGMGAGSYYNVHIDREKTDHFGREFVRPQSNMDVQFGGGYQPKNLFTHYECHPVSL